jgi:hypothetical protein
MAKNLVRNYTFNAAAKTVANESNGISDKLRAKKAEDALINTDDDITLDKLPPNLLTSVCSKVDGVSYEVSNYWQGVLYSLDNPLIEIAKNGGASLVSTYLGSDNVCRYRVRISGNFKGNSYSRTLACGISTVRKSKDSGFYVTLMGGPVLNMSCF